MDFFRFLGSKRFLKHLAAAVVIGAILIWFALLMLRIYTSHGDYLVVPDFRGKTFEQLTSDNEFRDYTFILMDSIFDVNKTKGTVLHQDPYAGSKVKKGRKIYLTIVSSIPEKTSMPDLKFLTLRQAVSELESSGLRVGRLEYIKTFDEDAVQQQFYDGKVIQPGTKIDKGSIINLVVGMGSKGMDSIYGPPADSLGLDSAAGM